MHSYSRGSLTNQGVLPLHQWLICVGTTRFELIRRASETPMLPLHHIPIKMRENLRATDWNNLGWLQGLHYDLVILHFCCVAPYELLRNSTPFSRLAEYFESDYIHSVTRDTVKFTLLTTKWPVLAYIFKLKDFRHQSKDKHQNYIEETDVLTIELVCVSLLVELNGHLKITNHV